MPQPRANQISDLYHRAVELPFQERSAFLKDQCGDDEALREEIESLLQFDAASNEFLERPAGAGVINGPGLASSMMIGRRLGVYTLTAPIDSGGMGVVYRAHDSKLGRDVAIKILPPEFVDDPERQARFAREARVLATLNHPHIGAIYGLEEADGVTGLVLELVEGPTLAQRLERGPVGIEEALVIAGQVADALAVAHERGIVHRDLKPSNIILTADPDVTFSHVRVKVVDFGLAKAVAVHGAADVTRSLADVVEASAEGRILGTAAYMSPEQARGLAVDKRTDIWAFGCVFFEMLTGVRAFGGETVTDTLVRVLEHDPDWTALPARAPAGSRTVLERCLRKDPAKRLHDISDAVIELEDDASAHQPTATPPRTRWSRAQVVAMAVGGMLFSAAITAAIVANRPRDPGPGRRVMRIPIDSSGAPLIRDNEIDTQAGHPFSVSGDGRYLVYIGRLSPNAPLQLILRALDQQDPIALAGTVGARHPFFSPDAQWIGFWSPDGVWKRIPRTGGNPVELWRSSDVSRGGTWLPDNTVIAATTAASSGLVQIAVDGGEPRVLTRPAQGELDHWYPSLLPGGRAVLFTTMRTENQGDISVLDLSSGRTKTLIRDAGLGEYVDPGYLVYAVPGALRARRFDLQRLEVSGESVTVLDGVRSSAPAGEAAFAVSRSGLLVFAPGADRAAVRYSIVWVDRSGQEQPLGTPLHAYAHPRLSRDDTRLAVAAGDEDQDLWLWTFGHPGVLTRLTSGSARELNPVWLPDNEHLLYASRTQSGVQVFAIRADGSEAPKQITSGSGSLYPISITPDGSAAVAVWSAPANTQQQLAVIHLDGNGRMEPLLTGASRIINGEVSPDGRWMAYQSNKSAREEIYVRPFPNVSGNEIPIAPGVQPAWCKTGNELFYLDAEGYLTQVTVDAGTPRAPHRVLDRRYAGSNIGRTFDISRDCQRFLVLKDEASIPTGMPLRMTLLVDWIDVLKRALPPQQ